MKWKAGGPSCKFIWKITALFFGFLLLASCGTDAKEPWEEVNPWDAALSEIEEHRYLLESFDSTAGFEDVFLDGSRYVAEDENFRPLWSDVFLDGSRYVADDENFRLLWSDEDIIKYAHMILHLRNGVIPEIPVAGYEIDETQGGRITSIKIDEERGVCLVSYGFDGFYSDGQSFLISMKTGEVIWWGYG